MASATIVWTSRRRYATVRDPPPPANASMSRLLVFQHVAAEPLGTLDPLIRRRGHRIRFVNFERQPDARPSINRYRGLIVLGGPMNVEEQASRPHLRTELTVIEQALAQGKPVLGICLGAQLLARALGGRNHVGGFHEFAWQQVELTPEAAADPLFADVPGAFPSFQWHDDHFDLPAGCVRLAQSPVAPNQAFRHGRAAYGMQFHFEADRALVRRWNDHFTDYLAQHHPGWIDVHEAEEARHGAASDAAGRAIAAAWAKLV